MPPIRWNVNSYVFIMMLAHNRRYQIKHQAQAIVEFALGLPLLLLLLLGTLELGRAFFIKVILENSAREGAHYFIYDPDDKNDAFAATITAVKTECANSGIIVNEEDITVQCLKSDGTTDNSCPHGSTVEVITEMEIDLAIFGFLVDSQMIRSSARMLVP